jgi:hypothetical protein
MIGSYDTCFVLSYNAPSTFCPSMDANVVAMYIHYKIQPRGEPLLRSDRSTETVTDIHGVPVFCTGSWKDPGNVNQFVSAISRLHHSLNQQGPYFDTCGACVEEYAKHNLSCRLHPGQFLVWRRGNPRNSETVKNAIHAAHSICSAHIVKGSCHLLPSEVRKIRDVLTSTGKHEDLQLFTIILVSIYLFLRYDEFNRIRVKDIIPSYSAVEKHKITNLCVKVRGKTDKEFQNLILWAYDDCPDLCPVRHLMTYVHLCQITEGEDGDGYLFPNLKKRDEPRHYGNVMNILNSRFRDVLQRRKITTHTFRKTGYLFAIWGDSDLETAKASARHKSEEMAQRYAACARFLLQTVTGKNRNAKYQVGRFKMAINIHKESAEILNEATSTHFQNLFQLSQLFLEQIGLDVNHGGRQDVRTVIDAAVRFNPGECIEQELETELAILSEEKRQAINSIFSKLKQQFVNEMRQLRREVRDVKSNSALQANEPASLTSEELNSALQANEPVPATNGESPSDEPSPSDEGAPSTIGKKRAGSDNLDSTREYLKKARGMERLEYIMSLNDEHQDKSKLTASARNLIYTAVIPVVKCLKNHHNNNKEDFLQKWPMTNTRGLTKFGKNKCTGESLICGSRNNG